MASVIKFVKGVRNHWKKSTVAVIAMAYGAKYGLERYEIHQLMRVYCEAARRYGDVPIGDNESPRKITVILNPNANKRKATKLFESYCAPILNLAGVCVDIIPTKSEGHARTIVENLSQTDGIVIAGGDGTVSEAITGLMRRTDNLCPVGILPVGRTNTFASKLFPGGDTLPLVTALADATMAVVSSHVSSANIMRIEVVSEDETSPNKPIYAVGGLEWGAYRDAQAKRDKYWVFGPLRNYATYIFNGYKNNLSWECAANISYSPPCAGCSNCFKKPAPAKPTQNMRWWSSYSSIGPVTPSENDHSTIVNEICSQVETKEILTSDMSLEISDSITEPPELQLKLGPANISYSNFISEGWKSENGEARQIQETIKLRHMELIPKIKKPEESWYSIDREDYEVKPVRITLLPKAIKIFCTEQ